MGGPYCETNPILLHKFILDVFNSYAEIVIKSITLANSWVCLDELKSSLSLFKITFLW